MKNEQLVYLLLEIRSTCSTLIFGNSSQLIEFLIYGRNSNKWATNIEVELKVLLRFRSKIILVDMW